MKRDRMEQLYPAQTGVNKNINLIAKRLGDIEMPRYYKDTVDGAEDMAKRLQMEGGFPQQRRMIRDKRHSLDQAMKYSYQGAWVKKWYANDVELMEGERDKLPVRALINPNKLKQDYDDKIISTGFENKFQCGDIFEWCNTRTYWIIYLRDYQELAYFRGEIRRCQYEIDWVDEEGEQHKTYAAVRGPVETKINYIQKHGISVDYPNYSLNILMPKTEDTVKYFTRYSKFYLPGAYNPDNRICWRVEATDSISMEGVLEINAVEYYANETEDDIENGLVGTLITKKIDPNEEVADGDFEIIGETFIKPKKEYEFYVNNSLVGEWFHTAKVPVKIQSFINDQGLSAVKIKWISNYSGQFDIWYGEQDAPLFNYKKTIVVESLF